MKKEHLCPVSFKHPFLTGWPPWEPEQWQQRVGLLTLKVSSIWMNLIWGCCHCGCSEAWFAFHTKPNSRFNRMSEARYVKGCRYNCFNAKMNKKVNTSKVTQSELSQIHAHCKKNHLGDLKVRGLLLLPSLIPQYWYYNQSNQSSSISKTKINIFIFIILISFLHNAQYSQWVRLSSPFVIQLSATNLFVHLSTYFHNNLISFHHFPWTFNLHK